MEHLIFIHKLLRCDLEASLEWLFNNLIRGFPGGSLVMNLPANAGDMSSNPVQEDPTCCKTTKLMGHKYWGCALEPGSLNYWACVPQLLKPAA